ncbi:MAG: DUF3135 domain-containing protein [Gammaproteobacteria bacterium]
MRRYRVDFDKWAELARRNPQAFEKLRSQFLANALNHITDSKRHKFECLQWRVDKIRQTTKTPLSACIKISQLMWDSFDELQQQYTDENSYTNKASQPDKSAKILPFQIPG